MTEMKFKLTSATTASSTTTTTWGKAKKVVQVKSMFFV